MKYLILLCLSVLAIRGSGQQKVTTTANLTAKYDGGDIVLSYMPTGLTGTDSVFIDVYRNGLDGRRLIRKHKKIAAFKVTQFADTTIRQKPGIYEYQVELRRDTALLLRDRVWALAYPEDARPVVGKFSGIGLEGSNAVALSWKMENSFLLRSITLLRSRKKDMDFVPVTTLSGTDSLYVDRVNDANEPFFYRLDLSTYGNGPVLSSASIYVIPQFKIQPLSPVSIHAEQRKNAVILSWENADKYARAFYVKKRTHNTGAFVTASSALTKSRLNKYEWTDTVSSLVPGEMYQYYVVAESNSFDQSVPSDTVTIAYVNKEAVLPAPQDLRVLTANDTTYRLVWTIDSLRQGEVAGFKILRKRKSDAEFVPMSNVLPGNGMNYVEILKPKDGDTFKVQAINGSLLSRFSESFTYRNAFDKEFGPRYLKAAAIEKSLYVKWLKDEDLKLKAYRLYKWTGKSFALIETILSSQDHVLTKKYVAGQLNLYKLTAINMNNEESRGTEVLQVN
ncbi:fibronectin type III domain-containing protein [Pedobacter ginsengisoli]|uniref:fibronectin type III domain-containing protein n=1 Tax=Pedobacter ginsengisoli TaxID=363852 RepID=UPI00254A4AEB|nr:fibronectin type III domain-containing protein [Pedobacter ginsengisoli]